MDIKYLINTSGGLFFEGFGIGGPGGPEQGDGIMAHTITTKYIYPPNFQGLSDFQDDAGEPNRGSLHYIVNITGITDGTVATDLILVALAELRLPGGVRARRTVINEIKYICSGFTRLTLEWDRDTDEVIAHIPGGAGAIPNEGCIHGPLIEVSEGWQDGSQDGTGNIVLTSLGDTDADTYNLTIDLTVKGEKN